MAKITGGAELLKRLRESGTGDAKLAAGRAVLAAAADPRKVSAEEVLAAIGAAFPDSLTVVKARALAETGEWAGPKAEAEVPIEDRVLARK